MPIPLPDSPSSATLLSCLHSPILPVRFCISCFTPPPLTNLLPLGNKSSPNTFTDNLLTNLGHILGSKPYIRVGGNTQDYALYNASLKTQINGTYDPQRSNDFPTTIYLGPSFSSRTRPSPASSSRTASTLPKAPSLRRVGRRSSTRRR